MMQTPPPVPMPPGLDTNFLINQVAPLLAVVVGFIVVIAVGAMALRGLFRSPMAVRESTLMTATPTTAITTIAMSGMAWSMT